MSIASWPSELPRPTRRGYGARRQDARRRVSYEAGPPKFERRFSAVARRISLELVLTHGEKARLDRFFIREIDEGSRLFWMPDPVEDGLPLLDEGWAPLLDETGVALLGAKLMLCSWGDEPPVEGPVEGITRTISFSVWEHPT